MFGGKLGVPELLIILGIALIFFGPSKLGDLGKGLGEAISNFKGALKQSEPTPSAAPAVDAKGTDVSQR
jgi:sec-independent protein translocase protein TatA